MKYFLIIALLSLVGCGEHRQWKPDQLVQFKTPPPEEKRELTSKEIALEALRANQLEKVKELIPSEIGPNEILHEGQTSLLIVVSFGYLELSQYLTEQGADPHVKDPSGRSAIDLAKELGFQKIYCLLSEDPVCKLGPELEIAILEQKDREIGRILNTGFDANIRFAESGETPLTLATRLDCFRCVRMLLTQRFNVDPRIKNKKGEAALELARLNLNQKIEDLIMKAIDRFENDGGTIP